MPSLPPAALMQVCLINPGPQGTGVKEIETVKTVQSRKGNFWPFLVEIVNIGKLI
jgi:hypothetical protein